MPFITVAIGIFLAIIDQLIKFWVNANLKEVGSISIIDNLLSFTYVENRGVAFGSFAGNRWIFVVLTIILILGIIIYMFKNRPQSKIFYISVALILGGGIGNLIDRIMLGYVIDYISFSFFPPVCNFADYCITVGTVILMIYVLFFSSTAKKDFENDKA